MKMTTIGMAAALAAAVLVAAPAAQAERPERGGRGGDQARSGSQENNREMGARRAEMMARKLGLDDATKQRLVALFESQQAERKSIHEKLQAETQKLRQLVRDTAPASALNAQLDALRDLQQRMANLQGRGLDEIRAILGPEKTARAVLMMQERMQSMREQVRGRLQSGSEGRTRGGRNRGGNHED